MNKKDNNDKKEEREEKKEDNIDHFVENIKAKKNVKMYDKKELDIIRHFEENPNIDDNLLKKEFEEKIVKKLPKEGSGKNKVENNVILIRPQIFPSNKQIQYDNQMRLDKENYLYQLIKKINNKTNGGLGTKDVLDKLQKYEQFINELHLQKIKEKLNLDKKANDKSVKENKKAKESERSSILSDTYSNSSSESNRRRYRKLTIYDKIWNCFCRSPLKPYSIKKRIWAGEEGIFDKEFQDNREHY